MTNTWLVLLLGWPAIVLALVISVLGIVHRKPVAQLAPLILLLPVSLYLLGTPRVSWVALLIPLSFIGTGLAVKYRQYGLAWFFLLPNTVFFGWLALIVWQQ
jgi:hypothetical protein